jgi:putative transposase
MPRANRYIVAGHAYHVIHRCHNRSFLFRFARDREEYRKRLRSWLEPFGVQLLTYSITSNHTHLLVYAGATESLAGLMQKLEGEFADEADHEAFKDLVKFYKTRTGAKVYHWALMGESLPL